MIIPIFIPQGGCPERCHFCNQSISGGTPVSPRSIADTIEKFLLTKKPHESAWVAFYGGTFTALRPELQRIYLDAVTPYLTKKIIEGVRLATRPDAIDKDWITYLKNNYKLHTIELGVQSFSDTVTTALGRTHVLAHTETSTEILKSLGINVGYHLMYGCPSEGAWPEERQKFQVHLQRLRPHFVRLHPLLVLKDTFLETLYIQKKFLPLSLEEAVERGADLAHDLEALGITIHRLGLQTNEILAGGGVVAGPHHPAFGELVKAYRYKQALYDQIQKILDENPLNNNSLYLDIDVIESEASAFKGQKQENIKWLKSHFPLRQITINVVKRDPHFFRGNKGLYDNFKMRIYHSSRSPERG